MPALRFPEFTDEWYKQSLGEIGETIIGLTYKPSDVVENNGTIVLRSSNIKNGVIDYSDLVRVNKPIKERIITKENDILICARNGSQRLIGKNAIIKKEDVNNTFGAFMMVYRSKDNPFILPLLSTKRYFSQVGENLGARINQITTSDFNGFDFYFPNSHIERTKIAELFRLIDECIATQNRIIEKLETLIKGIIVTHYSTTAHSNKVKIQDLGEAYTTMAMSKEQLTNEGNPCVFYGELFTLYGCVIDEVKSRTSLDKASSTLSYGRDLLFPASTTVDAVSLITPSALMLNGVIIGGDMFGIKVSEAYNPIYLSYYFNYIANKRLSKYAKGTTIIHLHYSEIANVNIELPNIEEQDKIVTTIMVYSTKLSVEKAILEKLSELKRYLLNQMFI